jgi:hypothetical protein
MTPEREFVQESDMSNVRMTLNAVALLASLTAAVAQDVAVQQKNFAYGLTLRESYDSNIFTSQDEQVDSFVTTVIPDFHYAWGNPSTDIALHYFYQLTYYDHRPGGGGDFDQAHDFTADLAHEFSPRLRLVMHDHFNPGFEPEIEDGARQRNGDYIQNRVSISPSYTLGGRWSVQPNFEHFFIDYDDPDVSRELDRTVFNSTVALRYNARPQTTVGTYFAHEVTDYEGVNRDATADRFGFSADHSFSPRLTMQAQLGVEARFYDSSATTELNPDLALALSYAASPRTMFTFQFRGRVQPTEIVQYLQQRTYSIMFGLAHQFTPRLTASASFTMIPAEYDSSVRTPRKELTEVQLDKAPTDGREDTFVYGINASYQFNMHWRMEIGATYTSVSSDFQNRTYDRGLGYIQTRVGF